MIFSLVIALSIVAAFFAGYAICYRGFVIAARNAQEARKVKRTRKRKVKKETSAIGFDIPNTFDEEG